MKTITLSKGKIYSGNLILINAKLPLQITDEKDLVLADAKTPDILIKREAANVLQAILEKINGFGQIVPVSGYRSASEQMKIYYDSLKENGKEFTEKYVALPHHSEHQSGFAIDLGLKKEVIDFICPDFPYEGICDEFRKTAVHYGFIERYPKGKEKITGIGHEPWHFRYVGYPHSEIISKNGLVLEEYIDFIKGFSIDKKYLLEQRNRSGIKVFYVPADVKEETTILVQEGFVHQVSGNNADGFVITEMKT